MRRSSTSTTNSSRSLAKLLVLAAWLRGSRRRAARVAGGAGHFSFVGSGLAQPLLLAGSFAHESAALHEGEDLRQLSGVEPSAVTRAHVDDHAARAAEILAIHALLADRARAVVHALDARLRRPLVGRVREGLPGLLVRLEQAAQQGVLHELPAALSAIEQAARGLSRCTSSGLRQSATLAGLERRFDDQPELRAAAGAVLGVRHVHLKTATAAARGDPSAAVAAAEITRVCGRAAHGALEGRSFSHCTSVDVPALARRRTARPRAHAAAVDLVAAAVSSRAALQPLHVAGARNAGGRALAALVRHGRDAARRTISPFLQSPQGTSPPQPSGA